MSKTWDVIKESVEPITKCLVVIVGIIYVVGLLVVNIAITHYGISPLGLAESQYIIVGALFAVLISLGVGVINTIRHAVSTAGQNIRSGRPRWQYLISVIAAIVILLWPIMVFSRNATVVFVVVISISAGVVLLRESLRGHYALSRAGGQDVDPDNARGAGPLTMAFGAVVGFIILIALYAQFVFPYMAREIGGGYAPTVRIALKSDAVALRQLLGAYRSLQSGDSHSSVTVPSSERSPESVATNASLTEPLRLVAEVEGKVIVARLDASGPAIQINDDQISAIVVEDSSKRSFLFQFGTP